MSKEDTINILKECNAGVKMGVNSIEEVLDNVGDDKLKYILNTNKEEHQQLGSEIHRLLNRYKEAGKEPNAMAKSMSWMKTNMKMSMDDSDATIADLITDGCNMGTKSLNKYLNQYKNADQTSRDITKNLIDIEDRLTMDLRPYL